MSYLVTLLDRLWLWRARRRVNRRLHREGVQANLRAGQEDDR